MYSTPLSLEQKTGLEIQNKLIENTQTEAQIKEKTEKMKKMCGTQLKGTTYMQLWSPKKKNE